MQEAIVVGQNTSNNCLVAKFSGTTQLWSVDTSFPTINGILWGVYAYSSNDIWVCGGTGNAGLTAPILYHYTEGAWVDHSSDITDAVILHNIDGSAANNVWVVGTASGAITTGAWQWNGTSWSTTKVNTVALASIAPDAGEMRVSVSSNGTCYIPYISVYDGGIANSSRYLYSNKTVAGFSSFKDFGTYEIRDVKAVSDTEIICSRAFLEGASSYTSIVYNGSTWTAKGRDPSGGIEASRYGFDALDPNHYVYIGTNLGAYLYQIDDTHTANAEKISTFTCLTHSTFNTLKIVDPNNENDIWLCTVDSSSPYTPDLRHYEGGTTWSSTTTDYGAHYTTLGAKSWYGLYGAHLTNTPILSNQNPAPDATGVAKDTTISFDITEATVGVSLTDTLLYIDGTLAYDGSTDTFQSGFNGPSSSKTVISGGYRFVIDPTSDFTFGQVITVRVVSKDNVTPPQSTLDETYSFTCVAALTPYLISGPVSPNPGYYISTYMEWKLGERE